MQLISFFLSYTLSVEDILAKLAHNYALLLQGMCVIHFCKYLSIDMGLYRDTGLFLTIAQT
jgi:hypothetical protein